MKNITAIAAGGPHTCALDEQGVACWGKNDYGESDVPPLDEPVAITARSKVTTV